MDAVSDAKGRTDVIIVRARCSSRMDALGSGCAGGLSIFIERAWMLSVLDGLVAQALALSSVSPEQSPMRTDLECSFR